MSGLPPSKSCLGSLPVEAVVIGIFLLFTWLVHNDWAQKKGLDPSAPLKIVGMLRGLDILSTVGLELPMYN